MASLRVYSSFCCRDRGDRRAHRDGIAAAGADCGIIARHALPPAGPCRLRLRLHAPLRLHVAARGRVAPRRHRHGAAFARSPGAEPAHRRASVRLEGSEQLRSPKAHAACHPASRLRRERRDAGLLFGFSELVDRFGFLYAFPDGTENSMGKRFWNATEVCCDREGSGVDDVAYLVLLRQFRRGSFVPLGVDVRG